MSSLPYLSSFFCLGLVVTADSSPSSLRSISRNAQFVDNSATAPSSTFSTFTSESESPILNQTLKNSTEMLGNSTISEEFSESEMFDATVISSTMNTTMNTTMNATMNMNATVNDEESLFGETAEEPMKPETTMFNEYYGNVTDDYAYYGNMSNASYYGNVTDDYAYYGNMTNASYYGNLTDDYAYYGNMSNASYYGNVTDDYAYYENVTDDYYNDEGTNEFYYGDESNNEAPSDSFEPSESTVDPKETNQFPTETTETTESTETEPEIPNDTPETSLPESEETSEFTTTTSTTATTSSQSSTFDSQFDPDKIDKSKVQVGAGFLITILVLFMILSAQQMKENPGGICAG